MAINRKIQLPNGDEVPHLGQGTWGMGENPHNEKDEIKALQFGIDQGLTLIDTAEMYADGGAEKVVGKAIYGRRNDLYIVSKVLPYHANITGTITACEQSLKRMSIESIDLYLLHWRGSIPLSETVQAMEKLIQQGKIKSWGVSNFDVSDLELLEPLIKKNQINTNQVLYNLSRRGIEYDLLPWSRTRQLPTMAYSPIEQGRILNHPTLEKIANTYNVTASEVALAWLLRQPDIIVIPKTSSLTHMQNNLHSLYLKLSNEDLLLLDQAFPPPTQKKPLEML